VTKANFLEIGKGFLQGGYSFRWKPFWRLSFLFPRQIHLSSNKGGTPFSLRKSFSKRVPQGGSVSQKHSFPRRQAREVVRTLGWGNLHTLGSARLNKPKGSVPPCHSFGATKTWVLFWTHKQILGPFLTPTRFFSDQALLLLNFPHTPRVV